MFIKPKRLILFFYPSHGVSKIWFEEFFTLNLPGLEKKELKLNYKYLLESNFSKSSKRLFLSFDLYCYHRSTKIQSILDFFNLLQEQFKVFDHILLQSSSLYLSDFMLALMDLNCDLIVYKLNVSFSSWNLLQKESLNPDKYVYEDFQTLDKYFNIYFKKQERKFTQIVQDFITLEDQDKVKEELSSLWTVTNSSML